MVAWLSPSVLARSAMEVVLSGLFANFADKRETQGGLSRETFPCATPHEEDVLWLDYASDLGDGFGPTYTIARMLAEPELEIHDHLTRRGDVLVLGGDEVYPSASFERYQQRFRGPYAAALPEPAVDKPPSLFAVPGNHDWYDGLTSFMRVFSQGARIGGWQTRQARSYFALRLPHRWWLWAIDIQFDAYIDAPQLDYFRAVPTQPGDRVILATAKPSWVHVTAREPHPQSWQSLAYIEERVMRPKEVELALTLTGDLHHYSRYESNGASGPKVTAGGGGAYLSPTHPLPPAIDLPELEGDATTTYRLARCWPEREVSRGMRIGLLRLLLPSETFSLNWLLGAIYGVLALLLALGIKDQATSLAPSLLAHGGWSLVGDAMTAWFVLLLLLLVLAFRAWAAYGDVGPPLRAWWFGALHALAHVTVVVTLTLILLENVAGSLAKEGFWLGYLVALLVAVAGCLVGRVILVIYLLGLHGLDDRWHANEVFAAQSRRAGTGFKHFLRLRIAADGVTTFVIGVPDVPSRWSEGPRPEPEGGLPDRVLVDTFSVPRRPFT
jgi:hypothetical protein